MVKEDLLLQEEMGRLVIEPIPLQGRVNENPFNIQMKRGSRTRQRIQNASCSCTIQKKSTNAGISKKKSNRILKEPVLQIIKSCVNHNSLDKEEFQPDCSPTPENCNITDSLNLCTLVKTCNQLKISSDSKDQTAASTSGNENKWWKNNGSSSTPARDKEVIQHTQTGSCSQQVLNPPCDVTIDELASYFETLVHIPKKMSSMAEMMYI